MESPREAVQALIDEGRAVLDKMQALLDGEAPEGEEPEGGWAPQVGLEEAPEEPAAE